MPIETPSVGRRYYLRSVQLLRNLHSSSARVYTRVPKLLAAFFILASMIGAGLIGVLPKSNSSVSAATTSNLNFQGRLLNASGGLVDDGFYNIQFNLYYQASGGSSLWNETYLVSNTQGVRIKNGYFNTYLGSITSFPSTIDWDQEIWLGMTIRGIGSCSFGACTPTDAEMSPRFKLTAVPYAFKSAESANVKSAATSTASTDSNNITVQSGNATGATSNSGNISIDSGTATGTTGQLLFGTTNASAITLGHAGITTTLQGSVSLTGAGTALTVTNNVQVDGNTTLGNNAAVDTLTVNAAANFTGNLSVSSGNTFTNAGSTVFTAITAGPFSADGSVGSAASTVDVATTINLSASTTGVDLTLASPTSATAGRILYINNTGANSLTVEGNPIASGKSASFIWNGTAWVQTISFTSTGVDTIGAIDGGTYSANGASISGTTIYLQAATSTHVGLVTTSAQNFAGVKTFDDGLVIAAGKSLTVTGGATGTRPASPTEGMVYYDTTTKQLLAYANGKWQADRTDAVLVAASSSSQADKDIADYVTDGDTVTTNDGDQVQINNALTAASGRKVVLLAGTYIADATILVPNNTTMQGVGKGTVIEFADIDATDNLIENSDTSTGTGVTIRDMKVDGRSDLNTVGQQRGIQFTGMGGSAGSSARRGGIIHNVDVVRFSEMGIMLNDVNNNEVSTVKLNNNQVGIYLSASSYNTVSNSIMQGNTNDGIGIITNSNGNTFNNNVIEGNARYGIQLYSSYNNTVSSNTISNNVNGIYAWGGAANNSISSNSFSGNTNAGISGGDHFSVAGNSFNNENLAINVGSYSTISSNTVKTASKGVYLDSGHDVVITGNDIYDSGAATVNDGVYITTSNNTVLSNRIVDSSCTSTCYAIYVAGGSNNYLADNTYTGPAGYPATINDAGTGTRYASQLTPTQVLQSGSSLIRANATSVITGSIDPIASTSVTGVGTFFTTELQVGDRITVSGETRTITAISSATALIVDTAFSDNANDTSVDRLPAALRVTDSTGANQLVVKDNGVVALTTLSSTNGTTQLCRNSLNELAGCDSTSSTSAFINGGNGFTATSTLGNTGNFDLNVITNNATRLTVQADGDLAVDTNTLFVDAANNRVGIGLTNPGAPLEVVGAVRSSSTGGQGAFEVRDGGTLAANIYDGSGAGNFGILDLYSSGSNTIRLRADSGADSYINSGNLAIDTSTLYIDAANNRVSVGSATAPNARLSVTGGADQTQLLVKANATQSMSNPLVLLQNSSGTELARINASTSSLYFGNAAGGSTASGANNTGIGASALGSVSTGTGNTTLGSGALASVSVGNNNTALGYNAGNLSTGSSNLFLGQGAGSNATTGSNNIIIGAGINASAAGVSNELRIGGVLQGDTSTLAAQFNGTLAVTTLGTADTSTFLCRNTSNQLASCSSTPLTSSLTDNITDALDLQESTNNYININTTNGSENVSFGNASTNPSYNFLGSGTLAVAGSQTIGGTLAVTGNSTLSGDLAVNGGDITTAAGDLTIAPAGNDTLITGNLDVSGTLFAGTGDAFQVSSTGAVTAVGVNSGTGLIQGTGGLTILGTTSINATGSSNTSIGATSNSGTIAIGNSASTTNILGATTINTTGTAATSIGNSGAITTLSGSSILLNSATLQRTSAGTTSFDLVDGANTTLALQNSGAGVLNLTVDGSATVGTNLTVSGGTATLGTAAQAGSLVVSDGSSSTITLKSATQVAATNYDVTVPAITANDTFCLFTLNNCVNANAFVQNGNSFTGAATLGTNDAYTLAFETNNITRITLDTSYKAYFGNGATNATPQGFTLQGTSGSGTNITGAGLTIASGQGTGTGTSGNITFQYAPAGASGSSLNALQTACTISGTNGSLSCPGAGSSSERFGAGATAGGSQSVALGNGASAGGNISTAIGYLAVANTYGSTVLGYGANAPGTNSVALGVNATGNTDAAVAVGFGAISGQDALALGYNSLGASAALALGSNSSANNYSSIALGTRATTTAANQLVLGGTGAEFISDAYFGSGVTSANAASRDFVLHATGGSGTNIGGADFTLAAGQGTGTGVGGAILFRTAAPGASGSSLNALTTRAEIQADGDLAVDTNTLFVDATNNRVGIVTATPSYDLSFGSGASRTIRVENQATLNTAGNNLTVQAGTGNGTGGVGGVLTLQGGSGSTTNINGGNVVIAGGASGGGTGVKGLVVIDTATYSAATVQNFTGNANITQSNIDSFGSVLISGDVAGRIATLSDPTLGASAAGRVIYVTNSGSVDITLSANTVGVALSITLKPASTATMFWNGTDWTAAGASSSTDLQAAYNNTAASAGNAEIVLSSTGTGGLTIRNDATTAITGGLLEVQTSIGSNLFTVNNNAAEYASNGGAESSTFTAWTAHGTGPSVTRYTTAGNNIATGVGSVFVDTTSTANTGAKNTLSTALTANLRYKVSYTARHTSSTGTFTTLETYFSNDGTAAAVECGSDATIYYNKWTRVDCTFTPTSVGASNAIFFRHTDAVEHDFYIDNFSVTVDASSNHAVDGQVDAALGANWQAYDADGGAGTSAVTRDTTNIYDTSGAVAVTTTAGSAQGEGVRNNMQTTPSVSTQYLVTFYAKSSTAFSDIKVGFLPAGGSGLPVTAQQCADYNTQTVSTTAWTKVTCIFTTPSSGISDPDVVIYQGSAAARTFYVDSLTVTLNTNNSSNVQIGGGQKGGPTTLLTLDRSYGAPIADNIDAYLGSMYYDTSTGRIQCYEADGWGACGAAPDNIVNLNPEYAGAVLNGSGVGTMTADFCADQSGVLQVNASLCDGTGSPAVKAANYYRWTSPQATSQTYSIYVTYQLPATFNGFSNDDTVKLTGRVDNITNATVSYEMYKSVGGTITACGTETTVAGAGAGSANTWYTVGVNGNESTGCSFSSSAASGFVIFKINVKANSNANAYVSTLNFVTTGR